MRFHSRGRVVPPTLTPTPIRVVPFFLACYLGWCCCWWSSSSSLMLTMLHAYVPVQPAMSTIHVTSFNNKIQTSRRQSSNLDGVYQSNHNNDSDGDNDNHDDTASCEATSFLSMHRLQQLQSRREMMLRSAALGTASSSCVLMSIDATRNVPSSRAANAIVDIINNTNEGSSTGSIATDTTDATVPVMKTSSGLKYIDIVPGTGISPSYGNLCSISYTAYVKLPPNTKYKNTKPQQYDHCDTYLIKHGNGRMIAGLDEGLHTMKVGGTRRLLIPPKLGFVDVGLGPLPTLPWNRYTLNQLLDQMIELSGGTMIYEVTLLSVIPDEGDLGYYTDASLSPQDFATLRENLQKSGNEQRIQEQMEEMAANTIKGQDRLL